MNTIRIKIPTEGKNFLAAKLELPIDKKPHNFAIFAHCFTCNKDLHPVKNISRALTENGFGVLRFDFTGLGESPGDFSETNFSSNLEDLFRIEEYLSKNYKSPTLIVGHSLGGAAAIIGGAKIETVRAIATIGAPASIPHVKHLINDSLDEINTKGFANVSIGGRPFKLKKQFIDDLEKNDVKTVLNKINKAILIVHSPQDSIVGIDNATQIYHAAKHPKSFVSIDGADHLLMNPIDSVYVGNVIGSWATRYVESSDENILDSPYQVSGYLGEEEKFTMQIKAGDHNFTADEPKEVGGNDFGPSPYELLSGSLAACTAMTLRVYADHKKWDLQEVYVHIERDKKHLEDCKDCENPNAKIDHFIKHIELIGELDDTQRKRLLQIAEKCPVNKTLKSSVNTETKLLSN